MHIVYYYAIFTISLLCTAIYAYIWHKHFNICFTMIFTFVPLCNLGYLLVATSENLSEAFVAIKIVYSSCFLALFILLAILELCNFRLKKWMVTTLFLFSMAVFASTLTIGETGLFYKTGKFVTKNGYSTVVDKTYGPMHTVFIIMIICYFLIPLAAMVYSLLKKKDVSNKVVSLLILCEAICFFSYFAGKKFTFNFDPIPFSYVVAQVIFLIIIRKISLYNVTDTGIDSIEMSGEIGFVSFDNKLNYLGGSDIALIVFPELMKVKVDTPASKDEKAYKECADFVQKLDRMVRELRYVLFRLDMDMTYDKGQDGADKTKQIDDGHVKENITQMTKQYADYLHDRCINGWLLKIADSNDDQKVHEEYLEDAFQEALRIYDQYPVLDRNYIRKIQWKGLLDYRLRKAIGND